jgi:NAD(P)-dependent dehydrogenase (short-subunit alcohol dehydrogenase family)
MAALQGKTSPITGVSRRIGRAPASALGRAGAHVRIVEDRPAHVWR